MNILKIFKKMLVLIIFSSFVLSYAMEGSSVEDIQKESIYSVDSKGSSVGKEKPKQEKVKLKVGMLNIAPFMYYDDDLDKYFGVAADIFNDIIKNNKKWDLEYVPISSMDLGIHRLENKTIDVLVGPVPQEEIFYYNIKTTDPFFLDTVVVVAHRENISLLSLFFKLGNDLYLILDLLLISLFLGLIVSLVYWRAELKKNDDFKKKPFKEGFLTSIFMVYSCFMRDLTYNPVTGLGRIITSLWIFYSVVAVTFMISILTSAILFIMQTQNYDISDVNDINRGTVGYIKGHDVALHGIKKHGASATSFTTISQTIDALERREVRYAVLDKVTVEEYLNRNPNNNVVITDIVLTYGLFGFGLTNSKKAEDFGRYVDSELFKLRSNHETSSICSKYLSVSNHIDCF